MRGQLVELAESAELFRQPRHPYTQALLSAVPLASVTAVRRPDRIVLAGEPNSPEDPPAGCPLAPRCPLAEARCSQIVPLLRGTRHQTACHLVGDEVSSR